LLLPLWSAWIPLSQAPHPLVLVDRARRFLSIEEEEEGILSVVELITYLLAKVSDLRLFFLVLAMLNSTISWDDRWLFEQQLMTAALTRF
jgi:hypothetical protein